MNILRLKELFETLIALPPAERAQFLQSPNLSEQTRSAIQRLLELDESNPDWEQPLPGLIPDASGLRQIGPFTITEVLGQGGMGEVYRAHREFDGVRQEVALKLVRARRDDAELLARFRVERQVLALLRHPHIATLIEAGEASDGTPFLAMEFIEGEPITAYAIRNRLSVPERVKLLRTAAEAIAHAHRNLIVHRDIKPSNVLVDTHGQVKVIDFGIAKSLTDGLGPAVKAETETVNRFFSPHNAAPEQLGKGAITAACDVYGLGCLLYELLTAQPVFDLSNQSIAEIQRTILEQEPTAPSQRLTSASGSKQSTQTIDADLDAITLYCLRKNPEDRYLSVERLIEDINAWLSERPVQARRGGSWYRVRRFAARNRRLLALSAGILVVVAIAAWFSLNSYVQTQVQVARADRFADLLMNAIKAADPGGGNAKDLPIRTVLQSLQTEIQQKSDIPATDRLDLLMTLLQVYTGAGMTSDVADLMKEMNEPGPEDRRRLAKFHSVMAMAYRLQGDLQSTVDHSQKAADAAPDESRLPYRFRLARANYELGEYQKVYAFLDAIEDVALDPGMENDRTLMRADLLRGENKPEQAQPLYEKGLAWMTKQGPSSVGARMNLHRTLVSLHLELGHFDLAQKQYDDMRELTIAHYGVDSLMYGRTVGTGALIANAQEDFAKAAALQREAVAVIQKFGAKQTDLLARSVYNLAGFEWSGGAKEQSYHDFEEAIRIGDAVWMKTHPNRFLFRLQFAAFLAADGHLQRAGKTVEPVLADFAQLEGLDTDPMYQTALLVRAAAAFAADPNPAHRERVSTLLQTLDRLPVSSDVANMIQDIKTGLKGHGYK